MIKTNKLLILLVTAGTLGVLAGNVQAGMYKWYDENGNTVYSQQPPEHTDDYQTIKGLPSSKPHPSTKASPSDVGTSKKSAKSSSAEKKAPPGESEEDNKRRAELRAKNCESAKKHLDAYMVYRRFPDKDGNMVVVSPAERQKKIDEAKQAIKEFCDQ